MFTPAHQQRAVNIRELNYLSIDLPDSVAANAQPTVGSSLFSDLHGP